MREKDLSSGPSTALARCDRAVFSWKRFYRRIDLVLVDWQLGGGHQGQEAIAAIREKIQYKDVVFYSGNEDTDELRRLAFEAGLEVSIAPPGRFSRRSDGVFDSLVKKYSI